MLGYIAYIFEKVISSSLFKGVLVLCGLGVDYLYDLSIVSKAIPVLFIFLIDTVLGTVVAVKGKHFSWKRFLLGIIKLFLYGIFIIVCNVVDDLLSIAIFTDLSLSFVIGTEFLSILKNMIKIGIKLPDSLVKRIEGLMKNTFKLENDDK